MNYRVARWNVLTETRVRFSVKRANTREAHPDATAGLPGLKGWSRRSASRKGVERDNAWEWPPSCRESRTNPFKPLFRDNALRSWNVLLVKSEYNCVHIQRICKSDNYFLMIRLIIFSKIIKNWIFACLRYYNREIVMYSLSHYA